MTFGIERLCCGEPVECRRRAGVDQQHKPMWRWESGAAFSHYTRAGALVVAHPDGKMEQFADGTWVRRDDKGG